MMKYALIFIFSICTFLTTQVTLAQTDSAARASASLRTDGTLLINGEAVFPIGVRIEGEGDEFAKLVDVGFNTLLTSGAVTETYFQRAAEHDLWVIGGHYDWAHFESLSKGNRHGVDFHAGDVKGLEKAFSYGNQSDKSPLEVLDTFDHYPTVFAWNTCEEPAAKFVEPLEQMYSIFKANSPDHLVVTLLTHPNWFHIFRDAGDVTIVDVYPYRGEGSLPAILSYDYVRRAIRDTGKPVWLMPQLYHGSYFSKDPADELTLQHIRQASYLGMIGGAKGIIFYSYYAYEAIAAGDTRDPQQTLALRWANLKQAAGELNKVSPLICDGRVIDFPIAWRDDAGNDVGIVPTRTFEYYGKLYVMVANVTDGPIHGSIKSQSRANPNAYKLSAFAGKSDLSFTPSKDSDNPAIITVGPNGQGVVLLEHLGLRPGDIPR